MSTDNDKNGLSRRSFLTRAGTMAGGSALLAGGLMSGSLNMASADTFNDEPSQGDIDILKFLAAAELIEDDLWQQYAELASDNQQYRKALQKIDRSIPRYVNDDRDNERSHHQLINAYLVSKGETAVNLDAFRTLSGSQAEGAQQVGRLTCLQHLTVDTGWYNRYRSPGNPDLGADQFPQIVNIVDQATIPTTFKQKGNEINTVAMSAAFHFATIEQGGASLYASLIQKVTSLDVLLILASIGPVEFYQFAAFHKSLENIRGQKSKNGSPEFPNLRNNPDIAQAILPEPSNFLRLGLPLTSVLHPSNTENAGAGATATALVKSGLFEGQSPDFLNAVVMMAGAADAAQRQCGTSTTA